MLNSVVKYRRLNRWEIVGARYQFLKCSPDQADHRTYIFVMRGVCIGVRCVAPVMGGLALNASIANQYVLLFLKVLLRL